MFICWGHGYFGQNGHSTNICVTFPNGDLPLFSQVDPIKTFACGASFVIAVTKTGSIYSWGQGDQGQLGLGTYEHQYSPQKQLPFSKSPICKIDCGDRHACFLSQSGELYITGDRHRIQIMREFTFNKQSTQRSPVQAIPRQVITKMRVTDVACGQQHTIVLLENSIVAGFGRNAYGQAVGAHPNGADYISSPTPVHNFSIDTQIRKVGAGSHHSMCIDLNGNVYLWGYGRACGVLQGHVKVPMKVEMLVTSKPTDGSSFFVHICGGGAHSVALTNHGDVFVMGENDCGQLGLGDSVRFVSQFTPLTFPAVDSGTVGVETIACSESYSAAITKLGQLLMWGKCGHLMNENQETSSQFTDIHYVPALVRDLGALNVAECLLQCGSWHAALWIHQPIELSSSSSQFSASEASKNSYSISAEAVSFQKSNHPTIFMSTCPPTMQRERTKITLREFYAATPTPGESRKNSMKSFSLMSTSRRDSQRKQSRNPANALPSLQVAMSSFKEYTSPVAMHSTNAALEPSTVEQTPSEAKLPQLFIESVPVQGKFDSQKMSPFSQSRHANSMANSPVRRPGPSRDFSFSRSSTFLPSERSFVIPHAVNFEFIKGHSDQRHWIAPHQTFDFSILRKYRTYN